MEPLYLFFFFLVWFYWIGLDWIVGVYVMVGGWDGMGWDGMGWDGMGWDGMELNRVRVEDGFLLLLLLQ